MKKSFQKDLLSIIDTDKNAGEVNKTVKIETLESECRSCSKCSLRENCTRVVFGDGDLNSPLMLVGEAPGAEEDRQGIPFVGSAGQLLNRILASVNIKREEVYITNIVKCRPPGNRLPAQDEVERCLLFLEKQIEIINPGIIVCLGSLSTRTLIDKKALITRIRGEWVQKDSRLYMPTFHPAALLRDMSKKRPVWDDFQKIDQNYREIINKERGL